MEQSLGKVNYRVVILRYREGKRLARTGWDLRVIISL